MAVTGFNELISTLESAQFFEGLLPFVVTYVLFFVALQKVHLFEDDRGPAIISVAAAFFTSRFIVMNPAYGQFFTQYFGTLVIGMIGILGLFTILAMAGYDSELFQNYQMITLMVVIAGAAFTVSGGFEAFIPVDLSGNLGQVTSLLFDTGLIWIIAVVALLGWTMKEPKDKDDDSDSITKYFWGPRKPGKHKDGD